MTISVLQLNMNADNYWNEFTSFIKSSNFDIIQLQEVTGAGLLFGNIDSKRDCFIELSKLLEENYNGELVITERFASGKEAYLGNATFYKKDFSLSEKDVFYTHKNESVFDMKSTDFENVGRAMLHLVIKIREKRVSFLNMHGAWGGTLFEKPHQTEQFEKIFEYLKSVKNPFVFTGDLNVVPSQPGIKKLGNIAQDLVTKYKVTNTLNPRTHAAKELFPKGGAVDYIFVDPELPVKKFEVLNEDLSDHFGLTAEIEI
jgi:endonuclease/exonuclease/phosphatase family metal-dependent hydrolase